MRIQAVVIGTLLLAGATRPAASSSPDRQSEAAAAFARLKALVGGWEEANTKTMEKPM